LEGLKVITLINCTFLVNPLDILSLSSTIVQHSLINFVLPELFKYLFSFNDRIRDATLGGSPFGHPLQQGFITGLLLQVFCLFFCAVTNQDIESPNFFSSNRG